MQAWDYFKILILHGDFEAVEINIRRSSNHFRKSRLYQ